MAMVNHEGRLVANLSQVTKVFKTENEYIVFKNQVETMGGNLNAFVLIRAWERPYVLEAEGKQVVLAEAEPTGTSIPDFVAGNPYTKYDVVSDGDRVYRCLMDIDEATEDDLKNKFEVIAEEYAVARPAVDGYLPKAGDIMTDIGPNGETRFYLVRKILNNPLSETNTLAGQTDEFVVDL